jgi:hypothetical protein
MNEIRYREYFLEILNGDITKNEGEEGEDDVENERELRINNEVLYKSEILQAVKSLRNGKAPGVDRIPSEALKVDPHTTTELLYRVIKKDLDRRKDAGRLEERNINQIPKKKKGT